MTFIVTHPFCLEHFTGDNHPEKPERLIQVLDGLEDPEFDCLSRIIAPCVEEGDILAAHDASYLVRLRANIPAEGLWNLDKDTIVSPRSAIAARVAAGAVCAAVDAVCTGKADNAFCAVRPPGHHAERRHAIGFCLLNNIAIGALRARSVHKIQRLAIIDIDVHHGNGTQNIFWDDPDACILSIHQWPLDLPTGEEDERGAFGNIHNFTLAAGADGAAFRQKLESATAAIRRFQPGIIMVAAGFDAHWKDPMGALELDERDFEWAARWLVGLAHECCEGRLVASLEGGYDLPSLRASAAAFVRGMIGETRP